MFKISATSFLLGCSLLAADLAHADTSRWLRVGSTDSSCSFSATVDLLEGFPFARLKLGDTVIPLVQEQAFSCQHVSYFQVPTPMSPPTFQVLGADLCLGRPALFSVVRALSGVAETCKILP